MLHRSKPKIISSGVIIERTAPYVSLSCRLTRFHSTADVLCWDVPSWANEKQISGRIFTILDDLTCLRCMLWRFSRRKFWWELFLYVCSLSILGDSAACLYYRCPLFGTLVYFKVQCLSTSWGYVLWRDFYLSSSRGSLHRVQFSIRKLYSKNTETMQNLYRKYAERKNFLYRRNTETLQKKCRNSTENFLKSWIYCRILPKTVRFFVILIFGSAYKEVIQSKGCIEKDF